MFIYIKILDIEWDMGVNIYKEFWDFLVKNDVDVWNIIVDIGRK